jgi:hypothetical protein
MSERYLVTGAQLGILLALEDKTERKEVIDEIIEKQFVGNSELTVIVDARNIKLRKPLVIRHSIKDFPDNGEIDNE